MKPLRLEVQGWRGIAHSYAVTNQFQCLALAKRPDVKLYFRDLPFYQPHWMKTAGLFSAADETKLSALREAEKPDAVYRISFPYDFRYAGVPTLVFATSEARYVGREYIRGGAPPKEALEDGVTIVTPSEWSVEGFIRAGIPRSRIAIVPHGTNLALFKPASAPRREELRNRLQLSGFVFFANVGPLSSNKGVDLLLAAFLLLLETHPEAMLLIKGLRSVYVDVLATYKELVKVALAGKSEAQIDTFLSRVRYFDEELSFEQLAAFYQAADAYVLPYLAEGFHMPALEAAAAGLPVIVTAGGPTDEYLPKSAHVPIPSQVLDATMPGGARGMCVVCEVPAIAGAMAKVLVAGPRARVVPDGILTWDKVAEQLVNLAKERTKTG